MSERLLGDDAPAPLVPQFFGVFSKAEKAYDEEERQKGRRMRCKDHVGLLVVAGIYAAFAYAFLPGQVKGAPLDPETIPIWVLGTQILVWLITAYVVYLDAATPTPLKTMKAIYGCLQGPLGRYIFLTRQTMALQFVHQTATVVLQLQGTPYLLGTYVIAPVVAGAGAFVTIQFFVLVYFNEVFAKDCDEWKSKGFHLRAIASALHVPQLLIAMIDLCVMRKRSVMLKVMPGLEHVVIVFFVYAILYVILIHWNHGLTGEWPYGILEPLGKDWMKWAQFTTVQGCILAAFGSALWELTNCAPVLW